jgi:hypothetical protein
MKKSNVEQIIKELAMNNFNLYSGSYPLKNGLATEEATMSVQDLGISYYNNREESEFERDEELGITQIDYVDWCMDSFATWIEKQSN